MDKGMVRLERVGDVGVIVVDHPPVNVLSQPVRQGLLAVLAQADADPGLHAVVIAAEGRTFVAGADIREFDKGAAEVTTQDVARAIDEFAKASGGGDPRYGAGWRV